MINPLLKHMVIIPIWGDAATDALAGGTGWVGAGLLGAVLAWLLLRYLPAKDAQLKEMIESRDDLAKNLAERSETIAKGLADHNERIVTELLAVFKFEIKAERDRCDKRLDGMSDDIKTLLNRALRQRDADPSMLARDRQTEQNLVAERQKGLP